MYISQIPPSEIQLIVDLRRTFITLLHPELTSAQIKKINKANQRFITKALEDNTYFCFGGTINNKIVCSAAIIIHKMPPLLTSVERKIGHVINVFTELEFRQKGYGLKLIEFMQQWAKQEGISKLTLNSTSEGRALYAKTGFTSSEKLLEWDLKV